MINLDKSNGHFNFENYSIKPSDNIQNIMDKLKISKNDLELWIENKGWVTYRLDGEEYILLLKFFNDNLKTIEVYVKKYSHQPHNRNKLMMLLDNIGGENIYSWGKIKLNKDIKANYESLLINYGGSNGTDW